MNRKTRKIIIWIALILTIAGLILGLAQGIWVITGNEPKVPWWKGLFGK
ncbi:hypothetical protein [Mycoplasma sp. (ex Biomphalaria glabrata)]|nr:hypothetical protein [Mycoplasma sp. (ex Biomphalaria glabrata)]